MKKQDLKNLLTSVESFQSFVYADDEKNLNNSQDLNDTRFYAMLSVYHGKIFQTFIDLINLYVNDMED